MNETEKISLLMKEYDTLRAEVIARTTSGFGLISVGAAILGVCAFASSPLTWKFFFCFLCAGALLPFVLLNFRSLGEIAKRICELERHVNFLAGENLLRYENEFGAAGRDWVLLKAVTRLKDPPDRPKYLPDNTK